MDTTADDEEGDVLCSTGVRGLDAILGGGLPANCFYLVQGDPGSGKTTLALQFLLDGVQRGESALYVTLSETKRELTKVARSHKWSLDGIALLDLSAIENLVKPEARTTVFHASELELGKVTDLLIKELRRLKPGRVVFDSLSEFRLISETPLRYRRQLLSLKQEFVRNGSTVLLLDDKMGNEQTGSDPHILSLAHGVIEMEQLSPSYGTARRRLRILKLRGVKFPEGYHDYNIETGGICVYPRIVGHLSPQNSPRKRLSSGLPELDHLFGGGLDHGTTTLIVGSAGTGKSTLALHFGARMASEGQRVMVFAFDETRAVLLDRVAALGFKLEPFMKNGLMTVEQVDPAELSPGEFANRIVEGVEAGCKLVVVDSLNGYLNSMPGESYLASQLHELFSYLNNKGVVTLVTLAQHGFIYAPESPVDLSYLADTVVSMRYFEAAGEVRQSVAVIKKRTGQHERTIREFKLESGVGIRIGEPLREFQGVLTGVPSFQGSPKQVMDDASK